KRDDRLSLTADHAVQQLAIDQRMRRETPQRHRGTEVILEVTLPDQRAAGRIEAMQVPFAAQGVDAAFVIRAGDVHGGRAAWASWIRDAVGAVIRELP